MELKQILNVLYIAGMLLMGGLALWYKGNATLRGTVAALIAEAEYMYADATKAGGGKLEWVVAKLCMRLPFLSNAAASALVQTTFDAVAAYAKLQLDRAAGGLKR